MTAPTAPRARVADVLLICRRCLFCAGALLCAATLLHAVALEPFHIPTGSMAPTLRGNHRVCSCPRCGQDVAVGRHFSDKTGAGQARFYRKAFCPNCGFAPLDLALANTHETPGDRVVVNKAAYYFRAPERWEIAVFRLLGIHYIKRLLGLPGEEILIHDGDLYVNGKLNRKTYVQAKRMRVLVFDQKNMPPTPDGQGRWDSTPPVRQSAKRAIHVDGTLTPMTLTYQNVSLDTGKCKPIRDEYAYNAGLHADSECVHDFMIETDVELGPGVGTLAFRLCDGHDWVEVRLIIGAEQPIETFAWSIHEPEEIGKLVDSPTKLTLRAGRRYRVEMALVDRRISLTIDDHLWLQADLPEAKQRDGVARPFQVHAEGVRATLHSFGLYRDIHHGQQGKHGVRGKSVRLGVDQYFVLGDNSPNSDDSRFWSDEVQLRGADLIGPVLWNR